MGLFDSGFRCKDYKELYAIVKLKHSQLLSSARASSEPQRQAIKSVKQVLEQAEGDGRLNFEGKPLTLAALAAIVMAISEQKLPVRHLLLSNTVHSGDAVLIIAPHMPTSATADNSGDAPTGSKERDRDEIRLLTVLCDYLRETETLLSLHLAGLPLHSPGFVERLLREGVACCPSLELIDLSNTATATVDAVSLLETLRFAVGKQRRLKRLLMDGWQLPENELLLLLRQHRTILDLRYERPLSSTVPTAANAAAIQRLLEGNRVVAELIDSLILDNCFKRQFRSKLDTFRSSVREHRQHISSTSNTLLAILNQQPSVNDPAYKWIAKKDHEVRLDPFQPQVSPSARWRAGYALSIGKRSEMQDVVSLCGRFHDSGKSNNNNNNNISSSSNSECNESESCDDWWAVFDGHGGREAACYAAEHLHQLLAKQLQTINTLADSAVDQQLRIRAIQTTFEQCQLQMAPWNTIVGTTALAAYQHAQFLYIANLGDSRAVLYNSRIGKCQLLTNDHRPQVPAERERIEAAGGFIEQGRVNGKLQVTRSLGDSALSPLISCIPEVSCRPIDADDQFLVLASDGLWDALVCSGGSEDEANGIITTEDSTKAAIINSDDHRRHDLSNNSTRTQWEAGCREVVSIVQQHSGPSAAAKALCEMAYAKGSTDNISVIVIFLQMKHSERKSTSTLGLSTAGLAPSTAASGSVRSSSNNQSNLKRGSRLTVDQHRSSLTPSTTLPPKYNSLSSIVAATSMAQLSLKPPMSFSSSTTTVGPLPPDLFGASSAHALATVAPSNPSSVAQNNSSSADRQRSTDDRKHVADSFADEMLEWLDKKMSSI